MWSAAAAIDGGSMVVMFGGYGEQAGAVLANSEISVIPRVEQRSFNSTSVLSVFHDPAKIQGLGFGKFACDETVSRALQAQRVLPDDA
jgi:predicted secreted protein